MTKTTFFIGLISLLIACSTSKSHDGLLTGSLTNIKDGTILYLIDIDSGKVVREIPAMNGKFKISLNLKEPRFFLFRGDQPRGKKDLLYLWLENSKIHITGDYQSLIDANVNCSLSGDLVRSLKFIKNKYEPQLDIPKPPNDRNSNQAELAKLDLDTKKVINLYRMEVFPIYKKHLKNKAVFYNLIGNEIENNKSPLSKADLKILYNELPEIYKTSKEGMGLRKYIDLPEAPKIGDKYIDFAQLNSDGKNVSLSSCLNKYTILEFWASWCGPCRAKHPLMRKMYNQYHSRGLNIVSVSGDTNKEAWIDAIQKDSITWTSISDLKGLKNEAFVLYSIMGVPNMILIDQNGIIIDNKLGQKILYRELEKIFN